MKYPIFIIISVMMSVAAYAKPHCRSFSNHDDKVTIVFSDDNAGKQYTVSDVKLIPSWNAREYPATSVKATVMNGVATVTLVFPHITRFSNPKVALRINGKKRTLKVCQ